MSCPPTSFISSIAYSSSTYRKTSSPTFLMASFLTSSTSPISSCMAIAFEPCLKMPFGAWWISTDYFCTTTASVKSTAEPFAIWAAWPSSISLTTLCRSYQARCWRTHRQCSSSGSMPTPGPAAVKQGHSGSGSAKLGSPAQTWLALHQLLVKARTWGSCESLTLPSAHCLTQDPWLALQPPPSAPRHVGGSLRTNQPHHPRAIFTRVRRP